MKKLSNKFLLLVLGLVFVLCAAFTGYVYYRGSQAKETPVVGPVAVVYRNGTMVDAVDLGRVKENYTKTYPGEDGAENTVEFAPGQVRMEHSSCPDQLCVGMGWQDGSWIIPIACLPNTVIVEVLSYEDLTTEVDGATN